MDKKFKIGDTVKIDNKEYKIDGIIPITKDLKRFYAKGYRVGLVLVKKEKGKYQIYNAFCSENGEIKIINQVSMEKTPRNIGLF